MFGIETISNFLGISSPSPVEAGNGQASASGQDLLSVLSSQFGCNTDKDSLKKAAAQIAMEYNIPESELSKVYSAIDNNDFSTLLSLGNELSAKYNIDKSSLNDIISQFGISADSLNDINITPEQAIAKELPQIGSTIGNRTLLGVGIGLAAGSFLPGLGTAVGGILGGITGFLFGAGKAAVNVCSKYSNLLDYIC